MIFFVHTIHVTDLKALSFVYFYQVLSTWYYIKTEISVEIPCAPLPRVKNDIFKLDFKEITHIYLKNEVYIFKSDWHDSFTKFKSSLNWKERRISKEKLMLCDEFPTYWEFRRLDNTLYSSQVWFKEVLFGVLLLIP